MAVVPTGRVLVNRNHLREPTTTCGNLGLPAMIEEELSSAQLLLLFEFEHLWRRDMETTYPRQPEAT